MNDDILAALQLWYDYYAIAIHRHGMIWLQPEFVAVIRAIREHRREACG